MKERWMSSQRLNLKTSVALPSRKRGRGENRNTHMVERKRLTQDGAEPEAEGVVEGEEDDVQGGANAEKVLTLYPVSGFEGILTEVPMATALQQRFEDDCL